MKKKLQIFVSSTYTDLREERQAAVEAILKSGNIPAGMELFTSGSESQLDTIIRWIDESDVYLLILGGRYGSIEKASGTSYTEIEYDYAVSVKKPLFSIVITDRFLDEKVRSVGKDVIETDNAPKYKEFKAKVLSNISSFFDGSKDVKLAIHETLQDFKERYQFSGWVPGTSMDNYEVIIEENRNLRIQLEKAKNSEEKKGTAKQKAVSDQGLNSEFEEIFLHLNSENLDYDNDGKKITVPLLKLAFAFQESMVNGITNEYGMSARSKLLFFRLMPKLAIYELTENEKVAGVQHRRFFLTSKGKKFMAFLVKKGFKK